MNEVDYFEIPMMETNFLDFHPKRQFKPPSNQKVMYRDL